MTSGETPSEGGINSAARYAAVASSLRKAMREPPATFTTLLARGLTEPDGTHLTAYFYAWGVTWEESIVLTPSEAQTILDAFAESLEKIAGHILRDSEPTPGNGR